MFKFLIASLFIALALTSGQNWEYENQSAAQKKDQLWKQVIQDRTPGSFPSSLKLGGIFLESMIPTMEHVADTLPEGRVKYIHSVGVVAQAKFVASSDSPYTGVFQGSDNVLLRLSCAKKPDTSKTTPDGAQDNFTPGLGIKFLRDGRPSASTVAMYGVNGFPSWNFFFKDAANHIRPAGGIALTLVAKKFSTATPHVQIVGLKDFAQFGSDGKEESNPNFPFKLIFRASSEVATLFPDTYESYYLDQLQTIKSGTKVYDVFAVDTPDADCKETKIGELTLTTDFTTSKFGDEKLFFRHQYMEQDLADRPEWTQYVPSFDFWKGAVADKTSSCPFVHLMDKE